MIATFHQQTMFHSQLFLIALRRFLWFGIFLENRNPKGSRASLGGIWEVLGFVKHLEGIWEAPGRHLGGIWEASGRPLGSLWEASAGVREASGRLWGLRGILEQKVFKTIVFYSVRGRDRPFRRRVAKVGVTKYRILHGFSARDQGATAASDP